MLQIAITPYDFFKHEVDYIIAILDAGWDYVHLRHPDASLCEMRTLINTIPECYHNRLRLHNHFELSKEFNLGGLHLNQRSPIPPSDYSGSLSRSCHSINEMLQNNGLEYVTLSPIFDSTSKVGYKSAFTDTELMKITIENHTVALGGITPETVTRLAQFKFIGYAVLGYLFNAPDILTLKKRLTQFEIN